MTEQGSKTLIGAFVLGALALFIAAILLVGSGSLFNKQSVSFVSFFSSSVQGLLPGSPVYFHGVRVGKVTSVSIDTQAGLGFRTPVVYEIQTGLITGDRVAGDNVTHDIDMADPEFLADLIQRGLRASLGTQSIVTGQLAVNLNMEESPSPPTADELTAYDDIQQIPAVASTLDTMLETFGTLPFQDIASQALGALQRINTTLDQANVPAIAANINGLVSDLRVVSQTLPALSVRLEATLATYDALGRNLNVKINTLSPELNATMRNLNQTTASGPALAAEARRLVRNADGLITEARLFMQEDSIPMLELGQTMRALRDAANSVSELATQLELQPNSLIFGRKGE